ncbi:MAG: hypothetical protein MJY58_07415 [Bacteroidaceae bacterium]|nr:hypothetical protein [Bacteroidaceae bacterium]
MTDNNSLLIAQFETKLRRLMDLYEDLKSRNRDLEAQLAQKEEIIAGLNGQLASLDRSYSNLKQSKVLEVSGHDLDSTRQRVEGLVREIDHCIKLLNSK